MGEEITLGLAPAATALRHSTPKAVSFAMTEGWHNARSGR